MINNVTNFILDDDILYSINDKDIINQFECIICKNINTVIYNCYYCFKIICKPCLEKYKNIGKNKCINCYQDIKYTKLIEDELAIIFFNLLYKCNHCDTIFKLKEYINDHIKLLDNIEINNNSDKINNNTISSIAISNNTSNISESFKESNSNDSISLISSNSNDIDDIKNQVYDNNTNYKTKYYSNKNILESGSFINDKFNGKGKRYWENGNIKIEGEFKDGQPSGICKFYDIDGILVFEGDSLYLSNYLL